MNTVTLPRELAQSLLVLMHRVYAGDAIPGGTWALVMRDLETALGTPEDASESTQATPVPLTPCRFCRVAVTTDGGLCAPCATDLLRDAQELEQSTHVCPRCDHA